MATAGPAIRTCKSNSPALACMNHHTASHSARETLFQQGHAWKGSDATAENPFKITHQYSGAKFCTNPLQKLYKIIRISSMRPLKPRAACVSKQIVEGPMLGPLASFLRIIKSRFFHVWALQHPPKTLSFYAYGQNVLWSRRSCARSLGTPKSLQNCILMVGRSFKSA